VGGPEKEKKIRDHLIAIVLLKHHSLCGIGVIRAYHARSMVPLMVQALSLYEMTPDAPLDGSV
jgi:hypothetical protein